ncbi:MAG: type II toxin-antitoxin system RelE/ParE family toxin [Gemmatimonadales bacterium]|nr:type II toxin-antitoxin system RelE/ParE family toxin [Gemmatimonadales bacterium]
MSSRPLLLRKEAAADLVEAVEWYDARRGGLGGDFLLAVRAVLTTIEDSPERFPIVRDDVRRAPLRRFPYAILYVAEPDRTVVIACMHFRRDPRRWQSRR